MIFLSEIFDFHLQLFIFFHIVSNFLLKLFNFSSLQPKSILKLHIFIFKLNPSIIFSELVSITWTHPINAHL